MSKDKHIPDDELAGVSGGTKGMSHLDGGPGGGGSGAPGAGDLTKGDAPGGGGGLPDLEPENTNPDTPDGGGPTPVGNLG